MFKKFIFFFGKFGLFASGFLVGKGHLIMGFFSVLLWLICVANLSKSKGISGLPPYV